MRTILLPALVVIAGLTSGVPDRVRALESTSGSRGASSASAQNHDEWIFPGEYESHEAMWMLWPTYENKAGFPSTDVVSDLVEAMKNHTRVNLAGRSTSSPGKRRRPASAFASSASRHRS